MDRMDLLPSVDALQEHLLAHDIAIRQIILLDEYIEQLSEQTIHSTMDGRMSPSFQRMIRIGVAEGIKRMYKEYRLQKWLKVQEMASVVRQVLSFASDDLPVVSDQSNTVPRLGWPVPQALHPAPPVQPLSPIITPNRIPGAASIYNHTVVSPAQGLSLSMGQITESGLYNTNRQLFPVDQMAAIEPAECAEDMTDISEIQGNGVDEVITNQIPVTAITQSSMTHGQIPITAITHNSMTHGQIPVTAIPHNSMTHGHIPITAITQSSIMHGQIPVTANTQNNITNGQSHAGTVTEMTHQTSRMSHQPEIRSVMPVHQTLYTEESDDDDDDDMMDWDDDMSMDENVAGVLFAAEHLLPEQQLERLDVEMGDMGIGHVLFDRVSATWYTSHCEFYRVD